MCYFLFICYFPESVTFNVLQFYTSIFIYFRTDKLPKDLSAQLEKIVIDNPIKQEFTKVDGKCRVKNMDTNAKFSVKQWAKLCSHPDHATPIYESQILPTKLTKKAGKKRKFPLDFKEGSQSSLK